MKPDDYPSDLHVGDLIKDIASQRHVSTKTLTDAIRVYQKDNSYKVYHSNDMDCENIVIASYLLKCNILNLIAQKYLSHLPFPDCAITVESRTMKIDAENNRVTMYNPFNNYDFLKNTHIGQNIREFAQKKGWKEKDMAKQLKHVQSSVSDLYGHKSIKVKTLIQISNILQYHFIAEAYLSQMFMVPFFNMMNNCTITLHSQQICSENPND